MTRADDHRRTRPPLVRSPVGLGWLGLAAVASISIWLLVEFLLLPGRDGLRDEQLAAAASMRRAHEVLWMEKAARGLLPDLANDPNRTGMIGPEYTEITTSLGSLPAKRTVSQPAFAAALVGAVGTLDMPPGAQVVIVVSGSLVGANVAAIIATEALGLAPIVVASTGASMWGATDPGFTWLDIEDALIRHGVIATRTTAAVIGGSAGIGRSMDATGIEAIRAAALRHGVPLFDGSSLPDLLDRVMERLDLAIDEGTSPGLVINAGGAVIGLGSCPESYELAPGLESEAIACSGGSPGIAIRLSARGVPFLHILNIRRLTEEWGLPFDPVPFPDFARSR